MFTHAAHARGEYEEAVRLAEEAVFLARRHDTGTRLMYAIEDLGALAISVGGYAHAESALGRRSILLNLRSGFRAGNGDRTRNTSL